jgi:HNH endonuclease
MRVGTAERWWRQIEQDGDCWIWTRRTNDKGYAYAMADGMNIRMHRWTYEQLIGPIPEGLELDHECKRRNCVNPYHLNPVTHAVNLTGRWKTYCKRGHPRTPDSVYKSGSCRACRKEVQ